MEKQALEDCVKFLEAANAALHTTEGLHALKYDVSVILKYSKRLLDEVKQTKGE